MRHETVGPGSVFAGRYHIEDLLAESAGVRCWLAVDEVLARSVAVHVLPAGDRRAGHLLEAARRSSVVPDARFVRVLDAAEDHACAFVVREWVAGDPLERVLAGGPLTPRRATWVARECAAAIATAHDVAIAHLRLVPANVLLTSSGGIKILGLATDAALYDLNSADPSADDIRGVGALLYACLVGRWPGESRSELPPAPREDGRVLRPRQVRPGIPRGLDDLCDRLLNHPRRSAAGPPRTAAELAAVLAGALLPGAEVPEPATSDVPAATAPAAEPTVTSTGAAPAPVAPGRGRAGKGPHWRNRLLVWAAVAALLAATSLLAYEIGRRGAGSQAPTSNATGTVSQTGQPTPPAAAQPLPIAAVSAFDPAVDGGSGEENSEEARLAADDDAATAWQTDRYYNSPDLSGLKPGVGLLVDLGSPARVREVRLSLLGAGTAVELRATPAQAAAPPDSADGFRTLARAPDAGERAVLQPAEPVTTRYLLVYLTSLPADSLGGYRGRVAEIEVFG